MCPLLWVHYNEIDIEVQGNSAGAHIRRARYHSSMVDSKMLDEGQEFRQLKDSYIIFIYKLDIENPIIRINTAFKGCSSLEKISVLPRIYHN